MVWEIDISIHLESKWSIDKKGLPLSLLLIESFLNEKEISLYLFESAFLTASLAENFPAKWIGGSFFPLQYLISSLENILSINFELYLSIKYLILSISTISVPIL